MTLLVVAVGAAVGAVARYFIDRHIQRRGESVLPWGTFTVNVIGSLLLGFLFAAARAGAAPPLLVVGVGTGLCGALTTFSTFSYETLRLVEFGARAHAALNVVLTVLAGLGAALVGWSVAAAVWPLP